MKETIKYYYNIDVQNIEEKDGKYFFRYQNQDFFFVFFNRNLDELDDILKCCTNMREKGIVAHNIIVNINGEVLTKVNNYNYILMSVNKFSEEYDIFDIVNISNKLTLNNQSSRLYRNNWSLLWSEKMDYFEYQIRELGLEKKIIQDRRIFYPNYKINFLNPLSFIFDLEVRDIAEYLKAMFFSNQNDEDVLEELKCFLQIKKLTPYEYSMLFARLLYPSYYFDLYDAIMNHDESEEKLISIIAKVDDFELFLKEAYLEISKYASIDKINWLIN